MKLMQVWIVCFVVFFGAAELYQWLQDITLPMPVFVVAGALLAIASNTHVIPRKQSQIPPISIASPTNSTQSIASAATSAISSEPESETSSPAHSKPPRYYPGATLPNLTPQRSISFTVHPSNPVREEADLGER